MRNAIALSALLAAAACAAGSHLSQTAAHLPQPDITIISHTDMADLPTMASALPAHFEFRIVNNAEVPITLRRIDLVAMGGLGIRLQSKNRPYTTVIEPHTVQSVDFLTTAAIADPAGASGQSPVLIRASVLFESPEGSFQKIVQQQFRLQGD